MGPAAKEFPSFQALSLFSLDSYCPSWRNYENPESYVCPPIFKFQNPDIGDADLQKVVEKCPAHKRGENAIIKSRNSEDAEYAVFETISTLTREKSIAPFIAVHSANLNRLISVLPEIFPRVESWETYQTCFREYDFIVIGPKIGFVAIEVKSSLFTQRKHFDPSWKHLPDDIVHAVKQQLGSVEQLLEMMEEETGILKPSPIRKFLFMPNLDASRYRIWLENLDQVNRERIKQTYGNAEFLFKEDAEELQKHLMTENPISERQYETYGSLLAGLASTIISGKGAKVELETTQLSEAHTVVEESRRVETQFGSLKPGASIPKGRRVMHGQKIIQLTPDQQKALEAPNRHVIIGPAGTGKTIILQEKALRLLRDGKKIVVFAPDCFMQKYRQLFECNGFKERENFNVKSWMRYSVGLDPMYPSTGKEVDLFEIYDLVQSTGTTRSKMHIYFKYFLEKYDAIFIDDTLDPNYLWTRAYIESLREHVLPLMAYSKIECPMKLIWVAMDATVNALPNLEYGDKFTRDFFELSQSADSYFACTILSRVMRCSENIFKQIYPKLLWQTNVRPVCGHKITGRYHEINVELPKDDIWCTVLGDTVLSELRRLIEAGANFSDIAIISGDMDFNQPIWRILSENGIPYTNGKGGSIDEEGILSFCYWNEVSSLEWPIVIHVSRSSYSRYPSYTSVYSDARVEEHTCYRAHSRATAQLIVINVIRGPFYTKKFKRFAELYPIAYPLFLKAKRDSMALLERYVLAFIAAEQNVDSVDPEATAENCGTRVAHTLAAVGLSTRLKLLENIVDFLDDADEYIILHLDQSSLADTGTVSQETDHSGNIHGMFGQFVTSVLNMVSMGARWGLEDNISKYCQEAIDPKDVSVRFPTLPIASQLSRMEEEDLD